MADMMTFRRCTEPDLSDVLAGLEGETINVVDHDGNVIGQAIVGQRIYSDTPRINLRIQPGARAIGA